MTTSGQKLWDEPGDRQGIWSAVLFADMVGYSQMMAHDERGVIDFMVGCSRMINDVGRRYGGVLVQTTGDGFLLLFDSAKGAVLFGQEFHRLVAKRQTNVQDLVRFRIGIHAGLVSRSGGMIYGNAVNVAARLESRASAGTCVVSQTIYDALSDIVEEAGLVFEAIGAPRLKNIPERIALYQTQNEFAPVRPPEGTVSTISTIGGLTLQTASGDELVFGSGHRLAALLGYLALSTGQRERNDKIATILWPERTSQAARRAFIDCRRRLILRLKQGQQELLYINEGHTGLDEIRFNTDLGVALADLRRGCVPAFLTKTSDWPEQILEGFEQISPVYRTWLKVMRAHWRTQILGELSVLQIRNPPQDQTSRDAAQAILTLEPGNEVAAALLIRHLGDNGNRAAALDEYNRLTRYLAKTHGLQPSKRVEDARASVASQVKHGTGAPKIVNFKPPRLIHLTVEGFRTPDGLPSDRAEGFRSELVSNLARFREWSVVDNINQPAHLEVQRSAESHLAYSIGGSLDANGRFQLSLRDLSSMRVIWSGDVTLESTKWVASQRDAIGRIAAHLETYISADRLAHVIGEDEHNATSHDRWLQAELIFSRWTPEAAIEATSLLRAVIADDPSFAAAYSSMASFANVQHIIRPGTPRDAIDAKNAHGLAQRAVELDQLDARNHLAVAWTAALTDAFDRAALHLDMATTLNPNGQSTLISCAMAYAFIGQADRGEALIDHVERIAPMLSEYQWCYVASVRFLAGRYEDALKAALKSGDRIVDNQGWIAASLIRLGRKEEARAALDRLIDGVRPVWGGAESPTAEAVFDWFTTAYPLRNELDRARLTDSLGEALRGQ